MDIENTSDQQSAQQSAENTIEAAQELAALLNQVLRSEEKEKPSESSVDDLLVALKESGLDEDQKIRVMVGSKKAYEGTIGGEGDRSDLTEKQAKTLREAFEPGEKSGSVRIFDGENNLMFHSMKGEIIKNDLLQLQKQTETPNLESYRASRIEGSEPPQFQADPNGIYQIEPQTDGTQKLSLVDGIKGDHEKAVEILEAFSLGEVITQHDPVITSQSAVLDQDLELSEKGIVTKSGSPGYDYSQRSDIPSLDDAPAQSPVSEPVAQAEAVSQPIQAPESTKEVDVWEMSSDERFEDLLERRNAQKGEAEPLVQFKVGDPLEELGQIALSQAVQIDELKDKLSEMRGKLDELTEWKESMTPMKLANERLGNWLNQQRDKVADKVHGLANKIAASATHKFEQAQDQVREKIDQGVERHNQAVDEVKTKVTDKVNEVRDSVGQKVDDFEAMRERVMNRTLNTASQKAAESFMNRFMEPATRMLIHQMDKVGATQTQLDGTKSFQTGSMELHLRPNGSTMVTRKATGEKLTPQTITTGEVEDMYSLVRKVENIYGLEMKESQTQTQSSKQTQAASKAVQKM